MAFSSKCFNKSSAGSALIELALIVPIVVLLGFTCIEFARALRVQQAMSTVVNEAAKDTFRFCSSIGLTQAATQSCLENVQRKVLAAANRYLPNLELRLSLYSLPNAGNPPYDLNKFPNTSSRVPTGEDPANWTFNFENAFNDSAADFFRIEHNLTGDPFPQAIVVAEVFFDYRPAMLVGSLVTRHLLLENAEFYDFAIY